MSRHVLTFAIALLAVFSSLTSAHPHVFADVTVKALFSEKGFVGIKNHWVYDEMYSAAMMSSADKDKDGKLSSSENSWMQSAILEPIEKNNYFNYVQYKSDFLKAERIQDFKAKIVDRKLVLDFTVGFSVPVTADYTMLVIVVSDPSNYIQMTTDMDNSDVDSPELLEVEYFSDALDGLTLFRGFRSEIEGLYLRYKKK